MDAAKRLAGRTWRHFMHDSLYRNSIYLLLSSLVNAGLGFIFWIICVRIFNQHDVGIATALISAAGLASGFGMLGFNNSIIRFLPRVSDKDKLLNSAFLSVGAVSLLAGLFFITFLPNTIDSLRIVSSTVGYIIIFLLTVPSIALNGILDNVFTAYRASQYTFIKNAGVNLLKVSLIFLLLHLGGFGIFTAYGLAFALITLGSLAVLIKKFRYRPQFKISEEVIRSTVRFSVANYVVSYVNALPALVIPLVITATLGAKVNAMYYVAFTIANILYFIPLGIANSLFAEGSHTDHELPKIIKKAAFITTLLIIPAIIATIIAAPLLLSFFGKHYVDNGVSVLRIMALSAIFLAICYPCGTILNIKHALRSLLVVNIIGASAVIGIVYSMICGRFGPNGIAWGWLIGWAVYALVYMVAVRRVLAKTSSTT